MKANTQVTITLTVTALAALRLYALSKARGCIDWDKLRAKNPDEEHFDKLTTKVSNREVATELADSVSEALECVSIGEGEDVLLSTEEILGISEDVPETE